MQLLQQRQHLGDPALPEFCFSLQNWPQIPVASQLPHHWPVHLQHSATESNSAPPSLVAASRTHSVSLENTIPSPNWVLGPVLCVRALPHPSALCVWRHWPTTPAHSSPPQRAGWGLTWAARGAGGPPKQEILQGAKNRAGFDGWQSTMLPHRLFLPQLTWRTAGICLYPQLRKMFQQCLRQGITMEMHMHQFCWPENLLLS